VERLAHPDSLPHAVNPASGYLASANSSRPRTERLREIPPPAIADDRGLRLSDVRAWNADRLLPLFVRLGSSRDDVEQVRERLVRWDHEYRSMQSRGGLCHGNTLVTRMLLERRVESTR
jgi:acyl-homoserine lactone acylase PvdQ